MLENVRSQFAPSTVHPLGQVYGVSPVPVSVAAYDESQSSPLRVPDEHSYAYSGVSPVTVSVAAVVVVLVHVSPLSESPALQVYASAPAMAGVEVVLVHVSPLSVSPALQVYVGDIGVAGVVVVTSQVAPSSVPPDGHE